MVWYHGSTQFVGGGTMEVQQEQCPAPTDRALETVHAWARGLTEGERWLMPHFPRRPLARLGLSPRFAEPSGTPQRRAVGGRQRRGDALWRPACVGTGPGGRGG